jgi:hypothetical protein
MRQPKWLFLVISVLGLAACQIVSPPHAPAATPSSTPAVSDYYGTLPCATLLVEGQRQPAGMGTSTWVKSRSGDQIRPEINNVGVWNLRYEPNRSQPWDLEQAVTLTLQPGSYVLAVSASWTELGRVEYGFWLTVLSTQASRTVAANWR